MNILDQIPFLKRNQSSSPAGGKFVIAHWDRDTVSYLIATSTQRPLRDNEFGLLSLIPPSPADSAGSTPEEPKRLPPLVVLASHLEEQGITVNRLAVLLSRPELDQLSLSLPPASQDELPRLVLSEVEQQQGEVADPPVVDYLIINENAGALPPEEKGGGTGPQVLAFALSQRQLELLQQEASTAGFKLIAIGSRQLAPLRLLPREGISSGGLAISIHLLSGEAEVAICRGREPVLLRSIRYSNEDAERVAEQIDTEANRCLTLLPESFSQLPVTWYIYETGEFARRVAKAVEEQEPEKVRLVDPASDWSVTGAPFLSPNLTSLTNSVPSKSASLFGGALDLQNQTLPINLLAPKRSPAPPNPWIRWGAIGALGTVAATTIGYFLMSDNWNLEEQIESLRNKLQNTSKVTSKYQQKSDQVAMVETWLSDQVDWVAELSDLASRLPDGQEATVRRLSASINAKGNGTIDLAMQVASQEVIAELENRIRGAKYTIVSKQITQNADSQEYPWQFESHIEFPIAAPPLKRFSPVAKTTAPKNATNPEPKKGTDSPDKPESNQEGIEEQPPENKPESTEGAAR